MVLLCFSNDSIDMSLSVINAADISNTILISCIPQNCGSGLRFTGSNESDKKPNRQKKPAQSRYTFHNSPYTFKELFLKNPHPGFSYFRIFILLLGTLPSFFKKKTYPGPQHSILNHVQ